MSEFSFSYEPTPWELCLESLHRGDTVNAVRLLTVLEGEEEAVAEEALQTLTDRRITLDIRDLPLDWGSGEEEKRLRREAALVRTGDLLGNLEQGDPLRLYLEEIASIPTGEDPQLLAEEYLTGDETVIQRLVDATISRAIEASCAMTGRGLRLLDLIQEASLGLWQGILNYEGGDFTAHVDWWISQSLAAAVTMQARSGGIGTKMRKALEELREADKRLLTALGRTPTLEELAAQLHITMEEAEVYQDTLRTARLLEQAKRPVAAEESPEDDQAVENTAYFQSRQRILDMLSALSEQEAKVLTLRFGLEGGLPCTPQDISARMGLTAQEVVAIEAAALEKLRKQG